MRRRRAMLLAVMACPIALGCAKQPPAKPWLTMPDEVTHAVYFPIGSADVHGAAPGSAPPCDSCHRELATGLPSTTFRTFTCTGCHVEVRVGVLHDSPADMTTLHAGVADYASSVAAQDSKVAALNGGIGPQAPEDGACLACHPTGMAVDHGNLFPLPHQDATGTQVARCGDCHVDPSDRRKLGCSACHPHDLAATGTAHAQVPGFVAAPPSSPAADIESASALCVRCHADGRVPVTVAGHATLAGGFALTGGGHTGPAGGGCLDCHPSTLGPRPFAADFTKTTCGAACHGTVPITSAGAHDDPVALGAFHAGAGVDFAGQVGTLGFDAACRSCHPQGSVGLPANHPFPVGAAPAHAPSPCGSCHTTATARADPTNIDCATCHVALDASLQARHLSASIPVVDYATGGPQCLFCHGDGLVYWTADHSTSPGTPLDGHPSHRGLGCTTCHRTTRLDLPFAASWGQQSCDPCHAPGGP